MLYALDIATFSTCLPTPSLARAQITPVREIPNIFVLLMLSDLSSKGYLKPTKEMDRRTSSHPKFRVNASRVYSRPATKAVAHNVVAIVEISKRDECEVKGPIGGGGGGGGGGEGDIVILSCLRPSLCGERLSSACLDAKAVETRTYQDLRTSSGLINENSPVQIGGSRTVSERTWVKHHFIWTPPLLEPFEYDQ